jgi:hypothetical protein
LASFVPTTEKHFAKIQEFSRQHEDFWNDKNYDGLAAAFVADGVRAIGNKVSIGSQEIRASVVGQYVNKLTAIIVGYRELGNSIVIAHGQWYESDAEGNVTSFGQWGNTFKIEGDEAKFVMENAG